MRILRFSGIACLTIAVGGCGGKGNGDLVNSEPILIEPSQIELVVTNGALSSQQFSASLDGDDVTADATWTFSQPEIGTLAGAGLLNTTGFAGGVGTITAKLGGSIGTAQVTVRVVTEADPGGLSGLFENPTGGADGDLSLLYPYDQTVFPRNVAAPELMFEGGSAGDAYKLKIREQFYEYTLYFNADPPSRLLLDGEAWRAIASSGQGAQSDPISVSLQRHSGGVTFDGVTSTWRVAQARLPGSVYYWQLPDACGTGNGRVLRLSPEQAQAEEFFQTGNCWGCHTVSRDGRTVAASFSTGSPFPFQTIDLSVEPTTVGTITQASGIGGTFSAFNHDGSKLLFSNDAAEAKDALLKIADVATGTVINEDVLGAGCGEPAWSPDGHLIAATCGYTSTSWTFDDSGADLVVAEVDADGISAANVTTLATAAGADGRPAYPNFSPDSQYLVYGRPTSGARSTGGGTLWMINTNGSNPTELTTASAFDVAFNPTFAPIRAGGYYWVAFMSRRDYGNRLVGANRQQLWITAISDPPTGGDPSHPAFYLRGQEDCGKSENAYFAPDPCIAEQGLSCETGIDCCSGHCVVDETSGESVCGDGGVCAADLNACVDSADCCNAEAQCIDGFCQVVVQ